MHHFRRHTLKESTAQIHAALDLAVGELASLPDYQRYLRGLYAFRAPVEAAMENLDWASAFGDWRPVAIHRLLAQDMSDLSVQPQPIAEAGPSPFDVAVLIGQLYVLEGSVLGARVLCARAQRLGLSDRFGARHLALQSAAMGNWKRFLELLEGAEGVEMDRAVVSAQTTFTAALRSFENGAR